MGVISVSSYRFCRTDDIGLLVEALNRCWAPHFPDEPPMTPAAFKRSIRDLQVWCSSCMVAFAGSDPIGVLIGAKRPMATLVHKIAVHPDHLRQGHGRHLLASLGSKLAILGPPRIVAEVPETFAPACALFSASGYVPETLLTDYVLERNGDHAPDAVDVSACPDPSTRSGSFRATSRDERAPQGDASRTGFVIPVTIDDLAANGLLDEVRPPACWERSVETLRARKDDLEGLAVATDARIEAYLIYVKRDLPSEGNAEAGPRPSASHAAIVSLRTFVEDGGARLKQLLSHLRARGVETFHFPKVHLDEISKDCLSALGFRRAGGHLRYAARARSG